MHAFVSCLRTGCVIAHLFGRNCMLQEPVPQKQKAKWRYLQKYWHKGAFFQNDADDTRGTAGASAIFTRDYSAPTGEDKFDKTQLPAVMQVGRRAMGACAFLSGLGGGGEGALGRRFWGGDIPLFLWRGNCFPH